MTIKEEDIETGQQRLPVFETIAEAPPPPVEDRIPPDIDVVVQEQRQEQPAAAATQPKPLGRLWVILVILGLVGVIVGLGVALGVLGLRQDVLNQPTEPTPEQPTTLEPTPSLPVVENHNTTVVVELNVKALIDGRSRLEIQNNTLWWHHFDNAAPGLHEYHAGKGLPTLVNCQEWYPSWNNTQNNNEGFEMRHCSSSVSGCYSSRLDLCEMGTDLGYTPILMETVTESGTGLGGNLVYTPVSERHGHAAREIETPSYNNNYLMSFEVDDNRPSGSVWYEIKMVFNRTGEPACTSSSETDALTTSKGDANKAHQLNIKGLIHGRSQLVITNNSIQWYHVSGPLHPGYVPGPNPMATIINCRDWFPEWDDECRQSQQRRCYSSTFDICQVNLDLGTRPTLEVVQVLEPTNTSAYQTRMIATQDDEWRLEVDNQQSQDFAAYYDIIFTFQQGGNTICPSSRPFTPEPTTPELTSEPSTPAPTSESTLCQEKYPSNRPVCEENEEWCAIDVVLDGATCEEYCAEHGGTCLYVSGIYGGNCEIVNAERRPCDESAFDMVCVCTMSSPEPTAESTPSPTFEPTPESTPGPTFVYDLTCQEKYPSTRAVCEENEEWCAIDVVLDGATCEEYCNEHGGTCLYVSGIYGGNCEIVNAERRPCDESASEMVCVCTMQSQEPTPESTPAPTFEPTPESTPTPTFEPTPESTPTPSFEYYLTCQEKYPSTRPVCEVNNEWCTFDVVLDGSTCEDYCAEHGGTCLYAAGRYGDYCEVVDTAQRPCDESAFDMTCTCSMYPESMLTCQDKYGIRRSIHICDVNDDSCTFLVDLGGSSCETYCATYGGICLSAAADLGSSCAIEEPRPCDETAGDMICTCTM